MVVRRGIAGMHAPKLSQARRDIATFKAQANTPHLLFFLELHSFPLKKKVEYIHNQKQQLGSQNRSFIQQKKPCIVSSSILQYWSSIPNTSMDAYHSLQTLLNEWMNWLRAGSSKWWGKWKTSHGTTAAGGRGMGSAEWEEMDGFCSVDQKALRRQKGEKVWKEAVYAHTTPTAHRVPPHSEYSPGWPSFPEPPQGSG